MYKLFFVFFISILFCGCNGHGHYLGYLWGSYVSQPEKGSPGRYSRDFSMTYSEAFDKVKEIAEEMDLVIFKADKRHKLMSIMGFDEIYPYCLDTTEVGVFFVTKDSGNISVDIACGNFELAKFAASEIYKRLSPVSAVEIMTEPGSVVEEYGKP